jgi:hypothetical protein
MQIEGRDSGAVNTCKNCGAVAVAKFCPECGQSTKIGIPRLFDLMHDGFGAVFSYDAKIWRTLGVLVTRPGQLTVDYIDGKRAKYLSPFQLFFWLEAIAFLSHRLFFSKNAIEIDLKTKALLLVGIVIVIGLAFLNYRKSVAFVFHLIAGTHIWSFLMLVLLVEYTVVPGAATVLAARHWIPLAPDIGSFLTLITQIIMVIYMVLSIRRVYTNSYWLAIVQTMVLFVLYKAAAFGLERILS